MVNRDASVVFKIPAEGFEHVETKAGPRPGWVNDENGDP